MKNLNEHHKLAATFFNGLAIAIFAFGAAKAIYQPAEITTLVVFGVVALAVGLHGVAQMCLRGMEME